MFIFGLCFFLYFLKLSGTVGFWSNLRKTDTELHQAAKSYQKLLRKFRKAEHDIRFLDNCKQNNVYPKFVRWKNLKTKHPRDREKYYRRLLNESLDKRHSELKILRTKYKNCKTDLMNKTTWMKYKLILFSINRLQDNICKKTKSRHQKKLDALIINKRVLDGIAPNPNNIITNLTNFELTETEIEVLRLGLKHGVLLRPKESEMIVIAEDIWYQINRKNALQDKYFSKHRVQTALKNLRTVQRYLNTLLSRGEIDEEEKSAMRPKSARLGRAHGLPKTHKNFECLPKFRPIVDTTGTPHYGIGKYLSSLLNPLTQNEFTLKDSFDASSRINQIPKELFDEGFKYVSFDVVSLFTNVPLKKTIDIILKRVYDQELITTKLQKRTLKKLLNDSCKKTAFTFNEKLFEQIDGVSMGSSLGPVLANIIMTQFEIKIVNELIEKNYIKHYMRFVDDTLLLIKPNDIPYILNKFNSFDKNLQFTVDTFDDKNVHFLDIKINGTETDIFYKPTHTGKNIADDECCLCFNKKTKNGSGYEKLSKCVTERAASTLQETAIQKGNNQRLLAEVSGISTRDIAVKELQYHRSCHANFTRKEREQVQKPSKEATEALLAFVEERVVDSCELVTLNRLPEEFSKISLNEKVPGKRTLCGTVIDHFDGKVDTKTR
ncbi:uncharacterized protein [Clytia hemisphaerica]|uniref:uncharacterized protein n=1 Tax=Clytia hemisphaerica TaxID=252671 RepID=UPI0034D4BE4D